MRNKIVRDMLLTDLQSVLVNDCLRVKINDHDPEFTRRKSIVLPDIPRLERCTILTSDKHPFLCQRELIVKVSTQIHLDISSIESVPATVSEYQCRLLDLARNRHAWLTLRFGFELRKDDNPDNSDQNDDHPSQQDDPHDLRLTPTIP